MTTLTSDEIRNEAIQMFRLFPDNQRIDLYQALKNDPGLPQGLRDENELFEEIITQPKDDHRKLNSIVFFFVLKKMISKDEGLLFYKLIHKILKNIFKIIPNQSFKNITPSIIEDNEEIISMYKQIGLDFLKMYPKYLEAVFVGGVSFDSEFITDLQNNIEAMMKIPVANPVANTSTHGGRRKARKTRKYKSKQK